VTGTRGRPRPETSEAQSRAGGRREPVVALHAGRYRIREEAGGPALIGVEAPAVRVRMGRGFCVTASAAHGAAPGSIFLDGAAQAAPFLDTRRDVYNLDHHEGCVRPFTLATCEQAMVLVRTGLDLRRRDWTVYANEPDLDTVLAIWVLLNHLRLNEPSGTVRARVMPLLRLQGVIDAHGLERRDLAGLSPDVHAEMQAWIDQLREPELAAKRDGRWASLDPLRFTADRLRAIDRLVYPPSQLDDVEDVEELARAEIGTAKLAIVCRAQVGICEVERHLGRLHGRRLGLIALSTSATTWTLRQVDPYLPGSLAQVYDHLNLLDPAAGGHRSGNRWGGSAEIGGSPRASGTRMGPEQIARACRRAFSPPGTLDRLARIAGATLAAIGVLAAALLPALPGLRASAAPSFASQVSLLAAALAGAGYFLPAALAPGQYGLRRPARLDWLGLLPVALLGALAGGAWFPAVASAGLSAARPDVAAWLAVVTLPLAAELLFRGLVHGWLVPSFSTQRCGGAWLLSVPAIVSGVLFALGGLFLRTPAIGLLPPLAEAPPLASLLGALVLGTAAAMARERSESIAASIGLHWAAVATVVLARAQGLAV
jgi:hypothetical protein